jgi:hypothetical protein
MQHRIAGKAGRFIFGNNDLPCPPRLTTVKAIAVFILYLRESEADASNCPRIA